MIKVFLILIVSVKFLIPGNLPIGSKQVLLVSSGSWNATTGNLQRYEQNKGKWKAVGESISVELGSKGLAWGLGLHSVPDGAKNLKYEGDKKSPAGIFRLAFAFGATSLKLKYPYKQMSSVHRCVDDSKSISYNRVIDSKKIPKDYTTYEHMKLASGLYDYGIFVEHNVAQVPMRGSCIFLHIRKGAARPTVGCTAMDRDKIKELLVWLDVDKNPLLIQAPQSQIDKLFRP